MKKSHHLFTQSKCIIALFSALFILTSCEKNTEFPFEEEETEVAVYSDLLATVKKALGLQNEKKDNLTQKEELKEELSETIFIDKSTLEYLRLKEWANACLNVKGQTISIDFTLTHDIDMTGLDWEPIGSWTFPYTGTFDGQGHSIKGLKVESESDAGFFGGIGIGGTVKNLHLEGYIEGKGIIGSIAAYNKGGLISGCSFSNGEIKNYSRFATGGICGFSAAKAQTNGCIVRNSFIGRHEGSIMCGGIIGANADGSVVACLVEDNIFGSSHARYNDIGGVVYSNNGQIVSCIAGTNKWNGEAAGIARKNNEKGLIRASLWKKNASIARGVTEDLNEELQIIYYNSYFDNIAIAAHIPSMNDALAVNGNSWRWDTAVTEKKTPRPYNTR